MLALTILGNNSALPAHGRHPTAQFLHWNSRGFLIDCGEGTQMQLLKYRIGWGKISHIFISHLHGDHYFGLPGLLNSMNLQNRSAALHLFGPRELMNILKVMFDAASFKMKYPFHFHAVEGDELLLEDEDIEIRSFKVDHRIPTTGFYFREKKMPRKINALEAQNLNVPYAEYKALQMGEDITLEGGIYIENHRVTLPAGPAASYAYCADTKKLPDLSDRIPPPGLMYHEATFLHQMEEQAEERFHATAKQAAETALSCGAEKLLLGHFSSQYRDTKPFLDEAREIFPNTFITLEGETYPLK